MIASLLGNALVVAAVAPALWIITRILRRPAIAHVLWVLLLAKFLTPPLVSIPISIPGWAVWVDWADQLPWLGEAVAQVQRWGLSQTRLSTVASAIWVIGSASVIWSVLRRTEAFRQAVASRGDVDPHASDLAERVDGGGMLFRTPPVLLVDAVHSPMLCGMGPCCWILFPRVLWRALPHEGRERLLAHELAHFRRGDCFVRLLEIVTTAVFWWHPMLWLARSQIETVEEDCCDAIAAGANPRSYAEAMLLTLDFLNDPAAIRPAEPIRRAASSCLMGRVSPVERRLVRIMRRSVSARVSARGRRGIILMAILLLPWNLQPVPDITSDSLGGGAAQIAADGPLER